ncbi:MAG: tetratricopeptide repeat protein [Chthoniobacteraceae bacterium]
MDFRPDVFIAAASAEMAPFRKVVLDALTEMGARPVEHLDHSIAYGPAQGVLNVAIGGCEAVIHLAGFSFGEEPLERTLGAPRRSFAMFEVDVAQALGKPVFHFIAQHGAPFATAPFQDQETAELQHEFREAISCYREHWKFSGGEELAELIRSLRPRLIVRRRLAQLPFGAWKKPLPGRARLLRELQEALDAPRLVVLHPPPSHVTIAGSSGKTTLAVEAAWRLYESGRFDFVFYIAADVPAEIEASVASLARTDALALLPDEIAEHRHRLDQVRQWFRADENAGRFLVILDGVDRDSTWWAVQAVLPWFERGTVLITSRMPLAWRDARTLPVGSLSREDATEFLKSELTPDRPGALPPPGLDRLADVLERQPLALQLAAGAITGTAVTPLLFMEQISAGAPSTLEEGESRMLRWQPAFSAVVERSLARLDARAQSFVHILVCLAPQPAAIPFALFARGPEESAARETLAQLERQRLVSLNENGQFIYVNRLLREVIRDKMNSDQHNTALGAARALIDAALPRGAQAMESAWLFEKLLPHCRVLLGQLNGHPLELNAGPVARALAQWLRESRRGWEAEPFGRRAVLIAEKNHGVGHSETVRDLRVLAAILRELRRFDEAEKLYRRAIAILEKQAGSDLTPDLYSLAACLRSRDRLAAAEKSLRRVLQIETRRFGSHHRRVAIAEHTLGAVLEAAHRPVEAVEFYRAALRTDEVEFGENHPRVALRLNNLATALATAGWHAEAIVRFRAALAIDQTNLGPSHPDLSPVLKELAISLEREENLSDAEAALRRALAIDERVTGGIAEETAISWSLIAGLLHAGGRLPDADDAAVRALALIELFETDRRQNPIVRATRANARSILQAIGRTDEEIARAVGDLFTRLRDQHPLRAGDARSDG